LAKRYIDVNIFVYWLGGHPELQQGVTRRHLVVDHDVGQLVQLLAEPARITALSIRLKSGAP